MLAHIGIVALGKGFLNVPLATFSLQPRSGAVGLTLFIFVDRSWLALGFVPVCYIPPPTGIVR